MATSVSIGRRRLTAALALVLSLLTVALRPSPARADTVHEVINVPATVIDNRCNGEPVALHGVMHIIVTTTPTPAGGTRVRSVTFTEGLEGNSLVSGVPYRGVQATLTFAHTLPPPGTGTFFDLHTTLLLPQGDAPAMLFVMVFKGTLAADGTVLTEVQRSYLLCRPSTGNTAL